MHLIKGLFLPSRTFRRTLVALAVVAMIGTAIPFALDAVIVSPTAIFLSDRTRSTQLALFNSGETPEELIMELRYGYPAADSTGALVYRIIDSVAATDPSAAAWVNIYPRRVTLAPGTRQTVRLIASPPAGLADGEYWARLVIRSNPQTLLEVTGANPGVRAGIQLEMRSVLPVLFRRGTVTTGIAVRSFEAVRKGDSLVTRVALAHEGNAAFLGSAAFEMRDAAGRVYGSWRIPLAIHVEQKRRFAFLLDSAARRVPAPQLQLTMVSERGDLPASEVLQSPRVTAATAVGSN